MKNETRDFDDYVDEVSTVTVRKYIHERMCAILHIVSHAADIMGYHDFDINWIETLEDVRNHLIDIEDCLYNKKIDYYEYCGKQLDAKALDLRNQIVELKKQYSEYLNS